jgi:non-canonical poly(A) RNA polymerase PAPD5/7
MEHETRAMIISIIEKTITQKYPDAKVLPFGSFETKLYLPLGSVSSSSGSAHILTFT